MCHGLTSLSKCTIWVPIRVISESPQNDIRNSKFPSSKSAKTFDINLRPSPPPQGSYHHGLSQSLHENPIEPYQVATLYLPSFRVSLNVCVSNQRVPTRRLESSAGGIETSASVRSISRALPERVKGIVPVWIIHLAIFGKFKGNPCE